MVDGTACWCTMQDKHCMADYCLHDRYIYLFFVFFLQGFLLCLCNVFPHLSELGFHYNHKLELCMHVKLCLWVKVFTWVDVQLALHSLSDALQPDRLQAVSVHGGGQAAQRLPDEARHLPHGEDLQQLAVHRWKRPQEHRLENTRPCSIIWTQYASMITQESLETATTNHTKRSISRHEYACFI